MQMLLNGKTRKMQRHPRPSGHRKTKAIAGSQKERKDHNKKAKEINKTSSIQSSPIEPPRTSKVSFPPVKNFTEELKLSVPQPRIITLGGSEDSEPSLDYSTPCILPTSADVGASQQCVNNLESPSIPSMSFETTDLCATSTSAGSDSPILLAALVQMLELKKEKFSLTEKLRDQREVWPCPPRKCWELEEGLHNYLRVSIEQECEEGMKWRGRIISELESSLRLWVEESKPLVLVAGQVSARIVPYGSFRLRVVDKHSDLDLLAILPQQITREEFFTGFCAGLRKEDVIKELRVLSTAFVPVVKFKYRGMEVDLTAACLNIQSIPIDNLFLSQFPTEELDPRCLRSLNGYRATIAMEQLVPDVKRFRLLLRFVKAWAKRRGLYGNIVGFLGGASWAILVAKVCQLEAVSSGPIAHLIFLFFEEMSCWPWPAPVALAPIIPCSGGWDPTNNPWDRDHVMPIITPSVPQINSAVNMDSSTLVLIKQNLEEGRDACRAVYEGTKTWHQIFLPNSFFSKFAYYLEVTAWARTDMLRWFGAVESRLRRLGQMLRNCPAISQVRIWPTPFPSFMKLGGFRRQEWYIGLCFQREGEETLETLKGPLHIFKDTCEDSVRQFLATVSTTYDLTWRLVEQQQLPSEVAQHKLEDNTSINVEVATPLDHLKNVYPSLARQTTIRAIECPRARFNYYYPNSAHWLSQSLKEPPMATSTPPPSPVGRSRSVSLNIPLEKKSVSQLESFSFPSATNLTQLPRITVPPPSFCDTSVPPPNPPTLDVPYSVVFEPGKSRLGSYPGEEDSIGWLQPSSPMRCWQVV